MESKFTLTATSDISKIDTIKFLSDDVTFNQDGTCHIHEEFAKLEYAKEHLINVSNRYYGEAPEMINDIVNLNKLHINGVIAKIEEVKE